MINMKWVIRFYEVAQFVSEWSKDPDRKVGAVVFRENRILGEGYNGYPPGVIDSSHDTKEEKLAKTLHAEVNAILHCKQDLSEASIVVTHHPCASCAAVIIQVGIKHVYCAKPPGVMVRWEKSFQLAREMFRQANIEFIIL